MKATQILGWLLMAALVVAVLWKAKSDGVLTPVVRGALYGLAAGSLFYLAGWLISGGAA